MDKWSWKRYENAWVEENILPCLVWESEKEDFKKCINMDEVWTV